MNGKKETDCRQWVGGRGEWKGVEHGGEEYIVATATGLTDT